MVREYEKSREALTSVAAAFFLMMLKLVVGALSGSLGILAEATNSALDVLASLITLGAVRYADRPADESHHYGHGKAENLGAFVQGIIVLLTGAWISWEALRRLFGDPSPVESSIWAFGVMFVSVGVSLARVRSLHRAAAEHGSQALEADALHFYTDIFTGGAVLVGLVGVWLGGRLDMPLLARADAAAALIVVVVLVRMTLDLMRHAMDVLLDRSLELTDDIADVASTVAGVERVHGIRTRQVGAHSFVDMHIGVARANSFEESHAIATAVEQAVHELLPRVDVVVHVDPVQPKGESLVHAIHAIAQREGLSIHHITLHDVAGRVVAHLHVELEPDLTLKEAHALVDWFEQQIVQELPELDGAISHIEPASEHVAEGPDVTRRAASLIHLVQQVADEMHEIHDCHDITVQQAGGEFHVSLHCTFHPDSNLQQVHDATDTLERRLRDAIPTLGHIVIHPEPMEGGD
ncbi:MAG: cation-efflux pump [Chloroflexota bacterium]|nr:cation-efflux pump [Chloroflexota bacterium]